jgi:hypothetical protein
MVRSGTDSIAATSRADSIRFEPPSVPARPGPTSRRVLTASAASARRIEVRPLLGLGIPRGRRVQEILDDIPQSLA